MGVNADMIARNLFADFADDLFHFVRQRAAISVAEHDPARPFIIGRFRAGERISRIGLVTIEKMLAVEQHLAAFGFRGAHAVADRSEVLLVRGLKRDPDVIVPGLGYKADDIRLGGKERGEARIVRRRAAGPARHAEGRDFRTRRTLFRKEGRVDRIGARIAGFDIVDAELIEHARDRELVGEREVDAIGLRAIAQRGVEQIKPLASHYISPEIIIRRQGDRDNDGDQRNHDVMGPQAEECIARHFFQPTYSR